MQLIQNGTQVTSLPAPATAVGTPGYGNNTPPGPDVTPTVWDADVANAVVAEIANAVTASGQTLTPGTFTQLEQAIKSLPSGRLLNIQTFTTAGVFTYTPTSGMRSIYFRMTGGGGGGGGGAATGAGQDAVGGGGASGSYSEGEFTSASVGASQTVTIGAAGSAGTAGANAGGNRRRIIARRSQASAPGGGGGNGCVATSTGFCTGNGYAWGGWCWWLYSKLSRRLGILLAVNGGRAAIRLGRRPLPPAAVVASRSGSIPRRHTQRRCPWRWRFWRLW